MATKGKQILKCVLFICLSFIKVSGFVLFNEEKKPFSLGSFHKNARTSELLERGDEKPKSGERVGCVLVGPNQAPKSNGDGCDRFSSDLGRADENAGDPGGMKLQPLWGQVYGLNTLYTPTVERLLDMKPQVDCTGDLMKLTIHGREAPFGSNFLIDRGSNPPLPLSQLPSECGHRFLRTWRDFVFIIPNDGCYVSHEKDTFVLPLLWFGLAVKMSCSSPTSAQRAPTVSCYTNGMIVRLSKEVSENLKIKVLSAWEPLLDASTRCGYSLVSDAESVVIYAPYMPCTEPKDGMFTLSMAADSEFNLSCPALSKMSLPDHAPKNYTMTFTPQPRVSSTVPPPTITTTTTTTTTETTQPIRGPSLTTSTSSTVQKLPTPPLHYYIPGQPNFKPVPPIYPFLHFPPNRSPEVVPQGPKIMGLPTAITQQPQAPFYIRPPQTWYPWIFKPSSGLTPVPSPSAALPDPREPLLLPTKAPKTTLAPLLKPTSSPQDELAFTIPVVPPAEWALRFPPRNLQYPGKPGFPQDLNWPYSQNQPGPSKPHIPPKPESAPPTPAPTRKAGPQIFHNQWDKPFPPHSPVMPLVPINVLQNNTVSTSGAVASRSNTSVKDPPMSMDFDYDQSPDPTPSLPKFPEVVDTPAPINACLTPICLSHSFLCPSFCSGPPSISFHNHLYFDRPLSSFEISSLTKATGQVLSSPVISAGSNPFPLVHGMGYNNGLLSSHDAIVPPASDITAMQYLVENPTVKGIQVPHTSKLLMGPSMNPSIFWKLESQTGYTWPTGESANVTPVLHPLGPSKVPSGRLQNGAVTEPLVNSNQSPKPPVYQAKREWRFSPWGQYRQPKLVAPNNAPFFEEMDQSDILKPTAHGKNVHMDHWYQATYSNAKVPKSDSPTRDSFNQMSLPQPSDNHKSFEPSTTPPQPEQTSGGNLPLINPQQYNSQSRKSLHPVFRGTYWVPAVQSNQDALLSADTLDGL
ncbi:flocculation protein FLO11-like [Pimephales promelas]|uniref:flocculation protein FLO11-like n=1 Tax=Pimephales promelas TaxID=90988 RepID=UPI0019559B90|nr:flocculation protein FLO11-like [Pimephales promelas]KAG1969188.1 hypothetical protein F2P79_001361 [Pimephales promelas]